MARDDKPVRLIPLDDEALTPKPVVRLENEETEPVVAPVRLAPASEPVAPEGVRDYRLGLPSKEELELRSHQPGMEALLESLEVTTEGLEEGWDETRMARSPVPWGWFALIGVMVLTAVVWSLLQVKKGEGEIRQTKQETIKLLDAGEDEDREAAKLVDQIDAVIREYFRCTSTDELVRHIRHPERVKPLVVKYYASRPVFTSQVAAVRNLVPLTLGERGNFWAVSLTMANRDQKNLIVEVLESGEPKIDWETLVDYQPMPWSEFVATRPKGESLDFRVTVAPDSLYSHEFKDTARWACFLLAAKNSEEYVFGYAPKGSEIDQVLSELVRRNGGKPVSLILRLSVPVGTRSPRGVVIEKLLSVRPIYVIPPDSGA